MHLGHIVLLMKMIVNMPKCNVFNSINIFSLFFFFGITMPLIHSGLSVQLHGSVSRWWTLLFRFSSFLPLSLATNVSVIRSFSICWSACSTVRDNFDFITKWMWSLECVSHILAEPPKQKTKAYSSTKNSLCTTAVHICVVWPLFYVLRCWCLRWFNENLYI